MTIESIIQAILNAIFIGIGVTIGNYLTQKHLIERLEKILKKLRKMENKPRLSQK